MAKYRVETDEGVFMVETDEAEEPVAPAAPAAAKSRPEDTSLGGFVGNVGKSAARFAEDTAQAVMNPGKTAQGIVGLLDPRGVMTEEGPQGGSDSRAAFAKFYKDRYGSFEDFARTLYEDPVGVMADFSTASGGVGLGAKAAKLPRLAQAASRAATATDPIVAPASAMSSLAGRGGGRAAEALYRSALAPTKAQAPTAKVGRALARTGLDERIPVSQSGLEKIEGLIHDINTQVDDAIQKGSAQGATVSRDPIGWEAHRRVSDRFQKQVLPQSDLSTIDSTILEFLGESPADLSLAEAQAVKKGTYRQLRDRAYQGDVKTARVETEKALASAIREEIARQFPEVDALNAREKKLLALDPALEHAVHNLANRRAFGIMTPVTAGGVYALTHDPTIAAVAAAVKAIVDHPPVRSRLAIGLDMAAKKAAKGSPAARKTGRAATGASRVQAWLDRFEQENPQQ